MDANTVVSQAVSVVQGSQPSGEAVNAIIELGTKMPIAAMELARISPIVVFSIFGVTWLVKKFLVDAVDFFMPFPGLIKWAFAFFVSMFSAIWWMPIVLPVLLQLAGGA